MPVASEVIIENLESLKTYFSELIQNNDFNYKNFGSAIEQYVEEKLTELLHNNGITDIVPAENKNAFPDLKVTSSIKEAIDIKVGNYYKKVGNTWNLCNNSENDLGTLNSFPKKIEEYGGENIYFFFLEYKMNDNEKSLVNIIFDHFYKFVGVTGDGMLKYREKDGNLRPKDFNQASPITTYAEFKEKFDRTEVKRSINISEKHLGFLKEKLKSIFKLDT